jgi:hypothetical protein
MVHLLAVRLARLHSVVQTDSFFLLSRSQTLFGNVVVFETLFRRQATGVARTDGIPKQSLGTRSIGTIASEASGAEIVDFDQTNAGAVV